MVVKFSVYLNRHVFVMKTERVIMTTKSKRGLFNNQGDVARINDPIWPVIELIRNFIYVHLNRIFQEDPIKTEQVIVRIRSNMGFSARKIAKTRLYKYIKKITSKN